MDAICRAILMADKCLLFDPDTVSSRKFLEVLGPRLEESKSARAQRLRTPSSDQSFSEEEVHSPFELECLEGAFLVAIGGCLFFPLPQTAIDLACSS